MVKIICQDCDREVEVPDYWDITATCTKCGGRFIQFKDSNKKIEPEDKFTCIRCNRIVRQNEQKHNSGCCDECEDEPLCDDCLVMFGKVDVCKKCVDKVYPRGTFSATLRHKENKKSELQTKSPLGNQKGTLGKVFY